MTERTKSQKFYIPHPLQNACACQISQSRVQVVNSDPVLKRFSTRKENNSSSSYKSRVEGDSSSSMEWWAWVLKQSHVTNTAHRAPYDTLEQPSCTAHTMKRQHSSNFLSLHSLIVLLTLNCTLKFILIHFLQPHLFHFKKNKKTRTTTNTHIKKGKCFSNFLILPFSCPSSLSFLFKSTDDSLHNFLTLHTWWIPSYFFWQALAFQSKSTYDDAD